MPDVISASSYLSTRLQGRLGQQLSAVEIRVFQMEPGGILISLGQSEQTCFRVRSLNREQLRKISPMETDRKK
jgi:hypothetical protein